MRSLTNRTVTRLALRHKKLAILMVLLAAASGATPGAIEPMAEERTTEAVEFARTADGEDFRWTKYFAGAEYQMFVFTPFLKTSLQAWKRIRALQPAGEKLSFPLPEEQTVEVVVSPGVKNQDLSGIFLRQEDQVTEPLKTEPHNSEVTQPEEDGSSLSRVRVQGIIGWFPVTAFADENAKLEVVVTRERDGKEISLVLRTKDLRKLR